MTMNHDISSQSIFPILKRANNAFMHQLEFTSRERSQVVKAMAEEINNSFDSILEANTLDLEMSREMAVPEIILDWLKLTPQRLESTVKILRQLAALSDPLEKVIDGCYQFNTSVSYSQPNPLGVIAFIYEGFPEIGAIAAGFALKTGNSIILRGSSVGSNTHGTMAKVLQTAIVQLDYPPGCLEYLSWDRGSVIQELVTQERFINLVIPYGRPSLVQQVIQNSSVPTLEPSMGNCYLYLSEKGDFELVRFAIIDSHKRNPDAVNAIEKVLINSQHKKSSLVRLFNFLKEKNFELRGDLPLVEEFPEHLTIAEKSEWKIPYLQKIVAFRTVNSLEKAIAWINYHSSSHADTIITESYQESRLFALKIDSALVYINSSPRFSRIPKSGESVFLGISAQKGSRRGLISLERFTSVKQIVQGDGSKL